MSNLTPFQVAQGISNNLGPTIEKQKDISAIDDIFAQVSESGKEADFDSLMGQMVSRVSPQSQGAAMKILQGKKEQAVESSSKKRYNSLGQTLRQRNPNSQFHQALSTIFESDIPTSEMNKVAKTISEGRSHIQAQQDRLEKDQVMRVYKNKIDELNKLHKAAWGEKEREEILQQITDLQQQRDVLVGLSKPKEEEEEVTDEISVSDTVEVDGSVIDKVQLKEDEVLMQDTKGKLRKVSKEEVKDAITAKYKVVQRK